MSTGLAALDAALGGGVPAESALELHGPVGTAKRRLAAAFLDAGAAGTYVADGPAPAVADALGAATLRTDPSEWSPGGERAVLDVADEGGLRAAVDRCVAAGVTTLVVSDGAARIPAAVHGLLRTEFGAATTLRAERLDWTGADRRALDVRPTADGVAVGPRRRVPSARGAGHEVDSTGVPGLDALCGGGFVRGAGVLLRHDGRADVNTLLATLVAKAVQDGYAVNLVPTIGLRERRLDALLAGYDTSAQALLEADRLFVLDVIGAWETGRHNVFAAGDELEEQKAKLTGVADRVDRPHLRLVNADAMAHALGAADARHLRYFQEASLLDPADRLVHVQNPGAVADSLAAVYEQAATQVLATHLTDDGRQYVALRKGPRGDVGARSLLDHRDSPPFLTLG